MRRNTSRVTAGGGPANWLGANFWSRTGGPLMWRSYDPAVVGTELAVLKRHGLTMTRSFFYWPDFMPGPYEIDETMTARFADFLDQHAERGLVTIPTFIVGHMSGENWDPSWRGGRHLYEDVWLVGRQAWFAAEMVRRYAGHPAVAGWLVSNEMPLYGGAESGHEVVATWAQIIKDAVRAAGGQHPFSLGDGAWGIEVTGNDNGFRLADVAELTDFLGPHTYPVGDDPVRQRYAAAVACELAGTFGKPVVMEEFGVSSDFASDDNAATYYRHVLHGTLLAGATGWVAWNNTDFDLPHQDPYRHHAFEQHFGLTGADGTPKATLTEMRRFADTLTAIDFPNCERADTDTALIVSGYLDTEYPFTGPDSRGGLVKSPPPGLRRRAARRPAAQADQGERRHRAGCAAVPRPVGQAVPRPHRRRAGAAGGRRRDGLRLLLRRRHGLAARPLVRRHERALRRPAPARRGLGRRDRRRPGRTDPDQGFRWAEPGHHADVPRGWQRACPRLPASLRDYRGGDRHRRPRPARRCCGGRLAAAR